jgi:hypothetical protein
MIRSSGFSRELLMFVAKAATTTINNIPASPRLCGMHINYLCAFAVIRFVWDIIERKNRPSACYQANLS